LLDGKPTRRGMSTKGLLSENDLQNSGYLERVIQNLEDNYGIDRNKVLNTEHYLDWRDRVQVEFPDKYETYIDYLISLNFLEAGLRK
jgi:hypothetical protein